MPKNILALSGVKDDGRRTPFAIACGQILNLAQKFIHLDGRVRAIEVLPQARDGRDGLQGVKGDTGQSIRGEIGPIGLTGPAGESIVGPAGEKGESIKGDPGRDGINGRDGSIISVVKIIDENLIIVLDDIEHNLGIIRGLKGEDGLSIKGDSGLNGKDGQDGKSILDVKLEDNHLLINLDGKILDLGNVKGDRGVEGSAGKDGEGSIGPKGNDGESVKGEKGQDGKDFDPKELIRLDNEISSIKDEFSRLTQVPEMTNGELMRKIEVLTGKVIKIE